MILYPIHVLADRPVRDTSCHTARSITRATPWRQRSMRSVFWARRRGPVKSQKAGFAWAFTVVTVNQVADVNKRINITGVGINIAQRVMDCGDAGHILLSKHVADDFEEYPQWRSHLHDLG